jgi:metal-responsive CopG/Arc/MetJ family transcriptional regulator
MKTPAKVKKVRVSITLDEDLLAWARKRAKEEKVSLSAFIENALLVFLAKEAVFAKRYTK